jgi:hypothetical protein
MQARKSWVKRSYIDADPVVERFAGFDLGPGSQAIKLTSDGDVRRNKIRHLPTSIQ